MSCCSVRFLLMALWLLTAGSALGQAKPARPTPKPTRPKQAKPPEAIAKPAPPVKSTIPPPEAPKAITQPNQNEGVYEDPEQLAEFPGGQVGLVQFLAEHVKYPSKALRYQITGTVTCKFVVDTTGRVQAPVIVKSLTPDCDSEVVRVIKLMPAFKPGSVNGRPLAMYFTVPVSFDLPDGRPAGWQPPTAFAQLLERGGLEFRYPAGMVETPIIPNQQQPYDYALRHEKKRFEVRYVIRPLDSAMMAYRAWQKDLVPGSEMMDPNELHLKEYLYVVLPNISGGETGEPRNFPPDALSYEFAADWGVLAVVPLDAAFGQKYRYCTAVAMHKADKADVYVFLLFDKQADMEALLDPSFHALRFRRD